MNDHLTLLKHISKYIQLTPSEQTEFLSILTETLIEKKSYLIEPNIKVDQLYYVIQGCLKAYYLDEQGNKHILQFAVEDWWITDFNALYNGVSAQLYIEAIEDCHLLGIKSDVFEDLFLRIPKFERFFRILYTKAFIALRKRVMSTLQKSNTERYLEFCASYPNIEERVTNYHIANYLGIAAESLSRIRRELKTLR